MSLCVCDGVVCGGEGYETDPGFCACCADLDGEEHCAQCRCEDCTDVDRQYPGQLDGCDLVRFRSQTGRGRDDG